MVSCQHSKTAVADDEKGILTLKLDKESYERAGLVGKPDGCKGKRGARSRWGMSEASTIPTESCLTFTVVEINLRLPSMLHGKKGFDRLVYAFTNALKTPVTWLFADLKPSCKSISVYENQLLK